MHEHKYISTEILLAFFNAVSTLAGCLAHRQYHRTLSDEGALLKNSAGLEKQYSRSRINECI